MDTPDPNKLPPGEDISQSSDFPPGSVPTPAGRNKILFGPNGLRAGWRILIFIVLLIAIGFALGAVLHVLFPHHKNGAPQFTPRGVLFFELFTFAVLLIVTAIMAKIERRAFGFYGLPWRRAFGKNFWIGVVWGFVALTLLLSVLRLTGNFYFGTVGLHGAAVAHYAALWGLAFVMVGFSEEFTLRGYPLFTLSTGMGFWPAAVLLSLIFAALHRGNPGETWIGLFEVFVVGMFFCFTIRRTGDLWFAIGLHAAWDWGQSFFYGTADSGELAPGHLFNSSFHGSKWLTGGTVGPEGSLLMLPIYLLMFVVFHYSYHRHAQFPDPAALRNKHL